jgi:uncharacterized membrane protein YeiH
LNKINTILTSTALALATGLFTGGVVATVLSSEHSLIFLKEIYFPASLFWGLYVMLIAVDGEEDSKNVLLFILSVVIVVLFFVYMIIRNWK